MRAADGGPRPSLAAWPPALLSAARTPGPITAATATPSPPRSTTATRPPTTAATPHPGPITAAGAGETAIAIGCADDHGFLPRIAEPRPAAPSDRRPFLPPQPP